MQTATNTLTKISFALKTANVGNSRPWMRTAWCRLVPGNISFKKEKYSSAAMVQPHLISKSAFSLSLLPSANECSRLSQHRKRLSSNVITCPDLSSFVTTFASKKYF